MTTSVGRREVELLPTLYVLSCSGDHTVKVTDVASGRLIHSLQGHRRTPWVVSRPHSGFQEGLPTRASPLLPVSDYGKLCRGSTLNKTTCAWNPGAPAGPLQPHGPRCDGQWLSGFHSGRVEDQHGSADCQA